MIRPGERIAADAILREGAGTADESLLTGESLPVAKAPGDRLVGGALTARLCWSPRSPPWPVKASWRAWCGWWRTRRPPSRPSSALVDRVSAVFVPVVIGLAVATFAGWWLGGAGFEAAAVNAVAVLVIACPCALGLATPAAIMVGTGVAARYGILIRDPAAMEQARAIRTVVFDKTGTLTEGRPALAALLPAGGETRDGVLRLGGGMLSGSEHPLGARPYLLARLAPLCRMRPACGLLAGARGGRRGGAAPPTLGQRPADAGKRR